MPRVGKPKKPTKVPKGANSTRPEQARTTHGKSAMIAAFADFGTVTAAASAAGITPKTHRQWLREDPDYAERFADACDGRADLLEQEAFRRAYEGTDKPVYQRGVMVGKIREYSDTLMAILLKGHRPEKYRDRYEPPPKGNADELTDAERAARVAAILDLARTRRDRQTTDSSDEMGADQRSAKDGAGE